MKFAEMMFYAENEGLIPTRTGNINAAIQEIKEDPKPTFDFWEIELVFKKHGLAIKDLTEREIRYINACLK